MSDSKQRLPHIDEIAASLEAAWEAFAEHAQLLALAGSHRFSDYALIFRLDGIDDQHTRLRAVTRALFPGFKGAVYRTLVTDIFPDTLAETTRGECRRRCR